MNVDNTSLAEQNSNSSREPFAFFKLASLNITSLPKHIDELRVLLSDRPLGSLSINETRLMIM